MKLFNAKGKLDVYTSGDQKTSIELLHFEFDISMTSRPEPNTATIKVVGLNSNSRNLFQDKHQGIEFYVGYDDDLRMIFKGNTTNVTSSYNVPNWETTIVAGDGVKQLWETVINKSYSAGTDVESIMKDMAGETGLAYNIDDSLLMGAQILSGETYSGTVKGCLSDLCSDYDYKWMIQNGTLEIGPKGICFSKETTAIELRSDTGMLESPSLVVRTVPKPKDKKKKNSKEEDRKRVGITAKALINPEIKPNRLVSIKSVRKTATVSLDNNVDSREVTVDTDNVYLVDTCRYFGNSATGDFFVEIIADIPIESNDYYTAAKKRFR